MSEDKRPGARPGSEGARRISEAHRGSREHDKNGGFAADRGNASKAGKKGIDCVRSKYGDGVFQERGRSGGEATRERFGKEYFQELGRRGAEARRKRRATECRDTPPDQSDMQ